MLITLFFRSINKVKFLKHLKFRNKCFQIKDTDYSFLFSQNIHTNSFLSNLFFIHELAATKSEETNLASTPTLNYDGLYQTNAFNYFYYLRFYQDGLVISASSTEDPKQIAGWFNKSHIDIPQGSYSINGNRIEFTTTYSQGSVKYEGFIYPKSLVLNIRSLIRNYQETKTYQFINVLLH